MSNSDIIKAIKIEKGIVMTYKKFKVLLRGMLLGDSIVPEDDETLLALFEYGLVMVSEKAESLHLLTLNKAEIVQRLATGSYMIRKPELPEKDDDEIDIDEDLCFALARYVASFISKLRPDVHVVEAEKMISIYNHKVYQILEKIKFDAENLDYIGCDEVCLKQDPNEYNG